jgi:hypothetical protein
MGYPRQLLAEDNTASSCMHVRWDAKHTAAMLNCLSPAWALLLKAVRIGPSAVPVSNSRRALAAAASIIRSSANDEPSSSSGSGKPTVQQQQQQQGQEDADPTGSGNTTPYPAPDELQRTAPNSSSTPGPTAQSGPAGSSNGSSSGSGPEPPQLGGAPPSNLPPQLQRVLLLLTEYGGIYGEQRVLVLLCRCAGATWRIASAHRLLTVLLSAGVG